MYCRMMWCHIPTVANAVITVSCRKSFFVLYLAQIHLAADLANTICITPSLLVSVIAFSQPSSYCDWFLFSPNGDPNFSWTILLFFVPFVCDGIWNAFFLLYAFKSQTYERELRPLKKEIWGHDFFSLQNPEENKIISLTLN